MSEPRKSWLSEQSPGMQFVLKYAIQHFRPRAPVSPKESPPVVLEMYLILFIFFQSQGSTEKKAATEEKAGTEAQVSTMAQRHFRMRVMQVNL